MGSIRYCLISLQTMIYHNDGAHDDLHINQNKLSELQQKINPQKTEYALTTPSKISPVDEAPFIALELFAGGVDIEASLRRRFSGMLGALLEIKITNTS